MPNCKLIPPPTAPPIENPEYFPEVLLGFIHRTPLIDYRPGIAQVILQEIFVNIRTTVRQDPSFLCLNEF